MIVDRTPSLGQVLGYSNKGGGSGSPPPGAHSWPAPLLQSLVAPLKTEAVRLG